MSQTWTNWARNQSAYVDVQHPRGTAEIVAAVRQARAAGRRIKAVGAGHSFTGIARPEGIALVLDRHANILGLDSASGLVTVSGGMPLHRLNRVLSDAGLSLTNLGDIDRQTVAGAVATGTHGTGGRFGGLATQIRGMQLVLADGSVLDCSAESEPEIFAAARVGLGALGIVSSVTLQAEPAFALRAREGAMPFQETLGRFDELVDSSDHFEFYWFPHTRTALTKSNTRVPLHDGLRPQPRWREWLNDEFLANAVFGATVALGKRVDAAVKPLNRISARALGPRTFTDESFKVFTSPRRVRFVEMEYAVPRDAIGEVVREINHLIEKSGWRIPFPIEVRTAAADDIPLSTAFGRDTGYVAVHLPAGADYSAYFRGVEEIASTVKGRPHWGKLHFLDATALRERYPQFDEFIAVRDRLDPTGLFGNAYLDRVLGARMTRRWRPIIGYAVVSSANQMLWLTFAPITTGAAHHYDVSVSTIGWLAEVFPFLYVVLALPSGVLLDRWFRPTLAAGAVLTAAGAVIRLLGNGFGPVLAGQVIIALAQPLVLNAVTKLAGDYLRPPDRSTGIAISSASIFAGMVLALLLGALLGEHRIPALLAIQAAYAVLAALVLCGALRRPGGYAAASSERVAVRTVWADPYVRRLTVMVFAGFGVFVALTTWLQALLEPAGVSESTAGGLLLAMVLAGVVGSATLPPRLGRHGAALRFVAASVLGTAAGCILLAAVPGVATGLVVALLVGFLLLTDLPVILELAAARGGPATGTTTGLLWLSGNAGGLLVAGAVQALVHHPGVAFWLLAAVVLIALPATVGLIRG